MIIPFIHCSNKINYSPILMYFQTAEAPLDERVVTIEGVGGDQETKELLADDGECYLVATEVLSEALPGEDIDTFIAQNAPVTLRLFMRGATVERVHAM